MARETVSDDTCRPSALISIRNQVSGLVGRIQNRGADTAKRLGMTATLGFLPETIPPP